MSREILFRGKRADNGEWVQGNLVYSEDSEEDFKAIIIPIKGSWMYVTEHSEDLGGSWMYVTEHSEDLGFEKWYKVDPSTVCQYTGLTDKNGKKIWENDIIKTSRYGKDDGKGSNFAGFDIFSVRWDDGGIALYSKWRRFNLRDNNEYEVIGDIFDNPELLTTNKGA